MKEYPFSTDFNIPAKDGTIDIAIRYDTVDGHYNWRVEENGLPVSVPQHVMSGILMNIIVSGLKEEN
jgi:hypothetical protein